MKRLALVVERDDRGRVSVPVGGRVFLSPFYTFVIGRRPDCDLVVNDVSVNRRNCGIEETDAGWTIVDYKGQNGVLVNGRRIRDEHRIAAGDRIQYAKDIQLRFDFVDEPLLTDLRGLDGGWVAYDVCGASLGGLRAFSLDGGAVRHGWMVAAPADDKVANAVASLAAARPGFPAVAHTWERAGLIHRVYLLEDGVPLSRLLTIEGTAAPEVASRLVLETARLMALALDMTGVRMTTEDLIVTWSGRLSCRLRSPDAQRQSYVDGLDVVAGALAPGHAPFRRDGFVPIEFDEAERRVREYARLVPPADEDAVAATLAALFPVEHRAVADLMEQLGCLDGKGLEALLSSSPSSPTR